MRRICGGWSTFVAAAHQRLEPSLRLAKGDKLVSSRVIGIEAWRDPAAATYFTVSPQRMTSTPAGVGTASCPLVKRPKKKLRELVRCNRGRPLSSHRLASLRYQRVRWVFGDELRQVGRPQGQATVAARYRPRRGSISCPSGTDLTERGSCITVSGACVKVQIVVRPTLSFDRRYQGAHTASSAKEPP
jgi:hypothetical protein